MINSPTPDPEMFARLAQQRHSCRAFRPEPLARERIAQMLTVAQCAPSDCNSQSWTTHILSGPVLDDLRAALVTAAAAGAPICPDVPPVERYDGILQDRRRACGWALYQAVGVARGDRAASHQQALENFRLFGAPHLALISVPVSMGPRGIFDAGIFAGFLLLAAEALGIAAVPLASITHYADLIRHHAVIAPNRLIICGVAFGIKDTAHPANGFRTTRAILSESVVWRDKAE